MDIFAQGIGIAAAILLIVAFQFRSNRMFFIFQMLAAALFAVNMLMIGAIGGFLLNATAFVRGIILALPKGKGINRYTLWGVILLTVAVYTWQFAAGYMTSWVDFLLPVQFIVGTVLSWRQDGRLLRIGQLFVVSPFCLVYNIVFGAIGGILTECFNILSIFVSVLRYGWDGFERPDQSSKGETMNV